MSAANVNARTLVIIAAVSGAVAVAMGAFGAHALRGTLSPRMGEVYQTAVEYQFIHTLLLLAIGLYMPSTTERAHAWACWASLVLLFGLLLFCGSLYGLALTGLPMLGWLTPFGGLAFILAWLCLALSAWHNQSTR